MVRRLQVNSNTQICKYKTMNDESGFSILIGFTSRNWLVGLNSAGQEAGWRLSSRVEAQVLLEKLEVFPSVLSLRTAHCRCWTPSTAAKCLLHTHPVCMHWTTL